LSVPRARRDLRDHRLLRYPAYAAVAWWRSGLPAKAERALRRGECEALMSHYVLVTRHLVRRVHAAGGQLYVWTVDDRDTIARLEALGVDAVITNDPRLFE
jgi:glycerophosphoryl diester phosphodiesterase